MGFCNGIENYSRHLDGREPGEPPHTLLDYFPEDFLLIVDESHQTVPQIGGMYEGDRVAQGDAGRVRLPPAVGARQPAAALRRVRASAPTRCIFVSATPARVRARATDGVVVEQIIRPTGLVDPEIEVRPDAAPGRRPARRDPRARRGGRARARDDADQADGRGPDRLPARARASACATCTPTSTRSSASRSSATCASATSTCSSASTSCARASTCPRSRWWRSSTPTRRASCAARRSLIQTIGRAARNVNGRVIMYADKMTEAMRVAIDETEPAPRDPGRLQRGARHHAGVDQEGRLRHRRVPLARRPAARPRPAPPRQARPRAWAATRSRSS